MTDKGLCGFDSRQGSGVLSIRYYFQTGSGDNPASCYLGQWYSTWGTRTPGGSRRRLRGYVKLKKMFIININ
jgi:hypothetical protein